MDSHWGHRDVLALTFRNPIWQAVWLSAGHALAASDDQENLQVEARRAMAAHGWLDKRL